MSSIIAPVVATFRPRWQAGHLVRFVGYISGVVAVSSVAIGTVLLWHRTMFPVKAYVHFPQTGWGIVFLAVGLFHSWRLIRWWAGKAEPWLEQAHLAEAFVSLCFLVFSVWSTIADNDGWLVSTFVFGGAVIAVLTSWTPDWSIPALGGESHFRLSSADDGS